MKLRIAFFAACVGTFAVATTTGAFAINDPIPGVDIIVRKECGGKPCGEMNRPKDSTQVLQKNQGGANPAKTCSALFDRNKTAIERLASAGDTAGIQAIFTKGGCPEPEVSVGKASTEKAKIKCKFTLLPPGILCTFGSK